MNIDPVHLAVRSTAEGSQKILNELEAELAEAKARRGTILADISKAQTAAEKGDKRQLFVLGSLNKQDQAQGRLILSIERQVLEARKRVDMLQAQMDAVALQQAQSAAGPADKWFEVAAPDGGKVRHRGASLESLQRVLQPGYVAVGRVFGHAEDGTGGFVSVPGAPSLLKAMLESQGSELLEFLAKHGIVKQPVVVLPANNRESVQ